MENGRGGERGGSGLLGIRLGDDVPTAVIAEGAVAVDALVRRADAFSDRPAGAGATTIISRGCIHIITTVPYGLHCAALRRNLSSEAFHPVRGLARAEPHHERLLAALVADVAARSAAGVVPVRECLYAALFALNVATCFGDGVDGELVEAMPAAQQEFLRILPSFRVFATFKKVARLVYRDRREQLVHSRRRQEEMYIPLIRARQERRRVCGSGSVRREDPPFEKALAAELVGARQHGGDGAHTRSTARRRSSRAMARMRSALDGTAAELARARQHSDGGHVRWRDADLHEQVRSPWPSSASPSCVHMSGYSTHGDARASAKTPPRSRSPRTARCGWVTRIMAGRLQIQSPQHRHGHP